MHIKFKHWHWWLEPTCVKTENSGSPHALRGQGRFGEFTQMSVITEIKEKCGKFSQQPSGNIDMHV